MLRLGKFLWITSEGLALIRGPASIASGSASFSRIAWTKCLNSLALQGSTGLDLIVERIWDLDSYCHVTISLLNA